MEPEDSDLIMLLLRRERDLREWHCDELPEISSYERVELARVNVEIARRTPQHKVRR